MQIELRAAEARHLNAEQVGRARAAAEQRHPVLLVLEVVGDLAGLDALLHVRVHLHAHAHELEQSTIRAAPGRAQTDPISYDPLYSYYTALDSTRLHMHSHTCHVFS